MISCPKCSSENGDQARYCSRCGAPAAEGPGPVLEMPCPACDGDVREVLVPMAVCQECGLHLAADGSAAESCPSRAQAAEAAPETQPAEPERTPCPVCETLNRESAACCKGCGIVLGKLPRRVTCPRCQAESSDEKCDCGAVLTLSKLLEYVDDSVKVVCPVCKGIFATNRDTCSDCGAALRPADSLKSYAAARQ
ncbi:MAG: hypothetical protein HY924_01650 [Elusimicrobia bacterium]|nr:hypothetical protein [Elusimicrobiota bacterium]